MTNFGRLQADQSDVSPSLDIDDECGKHGLELDFETSPVAGAMMIYQLCSHTFNGATLSNFQLVFFSLVLPPGSTRLLLEPQRWQ